MQPAATPPAANPTTSGDALTQLQQYQGSLQSPQQALDAAKGTLGVNAAQSTATGLQGAIQNTTNLLNQVAPSVYGRTGNSLVTTAQAGQQINNESAPLQQNLAKEGTDYSNAEDNYKNLLDEANTEATNTISGQNSKESALQGIYNDLYGKESDDAKLAEQEREANLSASSAADVARITAGSGSGTPSSSGNLGSSTNASYQQRAGGGYNFQAPNGQAISAAQYAQLTGTSLRTLLSSMAAGGDNGAKTALNYVGNDNGINENKLHTLEVDPTQYNQTVSILNSILGGVNKVS